MSTDDNTVVEQTHDILVDVEPKCKIEWDNLIYNNSVGISYISLNDDERGNKPLFNTCHYEFFNMDIESTVDKEKFKNVLLLGQSILVSEIKEYIRPYYYQLCQYLGIKKVGCITTNETKRDFNFEYKGDMINLSGKSLNRSFTHRPHDMNFNISIRDNRSYSTYIKPITIPKSDVPTFIKNAFDSMYSYDKLTQQGLTDRNYPRDGYVCNDKIVFCSEEHGICGNIIDPKTLYPLPIGFIMSNVMNSASISDKLASQQLVLNKLQSENEEFKIKIKIFEEIIKTNNELILSITKYITHKNKKE
jgi:hypothetical protein